MKTNEDEWRKRRWQLERSLANEEGGPEEARNSPRKFQKGRKARNEVTAGQEFYELISSLELHCILYSAIIFLYESNHQCKR
jgi:hypothetical protein